MQPNDRKYVDMNAVGPRFFETMGIGLLRGREFRNDDIPATTPNPPATLQTGQRPESGPRKTIVNESFAKKYFGGRDPVGLHIASTRNTIRRVRTK